MNRPFRYCLTCGRICLVLNDLSITEKFGIMASNEYHFVNVLPEIIVHEDEVWDICYGPFANSTPPADYRLNWDAFDEPAPDELAVMDENALSLLADFELEK